MKINYACVVVSLLACLFIYVFYRPEGTLINIILNDILPSDMLLSLKQSVRFHIPLNDTVVYSLPGGFWVFSATVLARKLRLRLFKKQVNLEWLPMSFALWLEFWQYFGVVKGRFDIVDILLVIIFGLLAIVAHKPMQFQQQLVFPFHRRSVAFAFVFVCVFLGHVFN